MWLKADDCAALVRDNWDPDLDLLANVDNCRVGLMNWEQGSFGSVKK